VGGGWRSLVLSTVFFGSVLRRGGQAEDRDDAEKKGELRPAGAA